MPFLLKNRHPQKGPEPAPEPIVVPETDIRRGRSDRPTNPGAVEERPAPAPDSAAGDVVRVAHVGRSPEDRSGSTLPDPRFTPRSDDREADTASKSVSGPSDALDLIASKFRFWTPQDGAVFQTAYAFDAETTAIDDTEPWRTPKFVLGAAFDGQQGWFIERRWLETFLQAHPKLSIVMHNAAFDLAVIHQHVPAIQIYDRVEYNLVMDTQLLHRLYKLATLGHTAFGKGQATLERCSSEYLGIDLPKGLKDSAGLDVRTSYSQWRDRPAEEIEPIYLEYLAKDAVVTEWLYRTLENRISDVLAHSSTVWGFVSEEWLDEQQRRWGPLTHHVQLKAHIVLNEITRNGLHLDRGRRDHCLQSLQQVADEHLAGLRRYRYEPGKGSAGKLQELLRQLDTLRPDLQLRRTRMGKYKTDRQALAELAEHHIFFKDLLGHREVQKLQSAFLNKMDKATLHPSFDVLKNTGRTSSFGEINAQNLPRDDRVRACFIPRPGCVFIDADYSTIELATLAQACLAQFRLSSKIAEAINNGTDLHKLVASRVTGKALDDVSDEERWAAKAINFGKPGGMGSTAFKDYAKANFDLELSEHPQ